MSKEGFVVNGKWGKSTLVVDIEKRKIFGGCYITSNMVDQIMEQINPRMQTRFGDYRWSLEGYKGNYNIVARYDRGVFIDGSGKTPQEAFFNCAQVRGVFGSL